MHDTFLSPYWYRIAKLHPRLRSHVNVRMQRTRGQAWYVLHNQATGRYHRVNAHAFELVGRLDGRLSVEEIWHLLLQQQGDSAPTQNDIIRIVGQLTDAGLVQAEATPDVRKLIEASQARDRRERRARLNPLSFRVGLFNPSHLLELIYPRVEGLLGASTLVIWLLSMCLAGVALWANWPEVSRYAGLNFLTPGFLAASWVVYPLMKALHELAHALMLRRFGCEVPEVGVNFFLFVPLPYVDASGSNQLVSRRQRVFISAGGIMVELALAALGLALWLSVEDGFMRLLAFVLMAIGGLSTLLFNGNPLMKFDGYFVACDLLDLPNLGQRSSRQTERVFTRLVARLLGMPQAPHDALESDWMERWALRLYAPLAWLYRLGVSMLIVHWASDKSSLLGLGVLAWMLWGAVLMPLRSWVGSLADTPGFASARSRASFGGGLLLVGVLAALLWVPVPSFVVLDGVVWLPPDAQVRAQSDGEVSAMLVRSGQRVQKGQALIRLNDPNLQMRHEVVLAQIEGARAALNAAFGVDALKLGNAQQALERDQALLAQIESDLDHLVLRAASDGEFVLSRQEDMESRQVNRGQLLAYVLNDQSTVVRALVSQRDVDEVRARLASVSVMLAERPGTTLSARALQDSPAAIDRLPSAALGQKSGGPIPTDATDQEGMKPAEPMFVMDVALDERLPRAGGLAKVRLDLKAQPLMQTWVMRLRQLFLRHFSDVGASG